MLFGTALTGPMLATLVQQYCDALNSSETPVIRNAWDRVAETQCRDACDAAIALHKKLLAEASAAGGGAGASSGSAGAGSGSGSGSDSGSGGGSGTATVLEVEELDRVLTRCRQQAVELFNRDAVVVRAIRCTQAPRLSLASACANYLIVQGTGEWFLVVLPVVIRTARTTATRCQSWNARSPHCKRRTFGGTTVPAQTRVTLHCRTPLTCIGRSSIRYQLHKVVSAVVGGFSYRGARHAGEWMIAFGVGRSLPKTRQ